MTAPRPAQCRLILIVAVFVVFGRLLLCDFTWWDDQHTIHHNPQLNPVQWDTFTHNWTQPSASIYIPLTFTVWALLSFVARVQPDAAGITLNPMFFHGASVLIHALGSLAAFAIVRRLVKNDLAALLSALLWALHPVQVESVGWASGLKDVLSGSLVLASLAMYLRWRQDGPHKWNWPYVAAVAIYMLAMLAKPSAFTMPLLLIVIDRLAIRTPWKRIAIALVPFAIVTVPIAIIARSAQPSVASAQPGWVRPFVVGDSLSFYALKAIAPIELAFDYGRNINWLRAQSELYYAWLLPVGVALLTTLAYRRAKRLGRPISPLVAIGLWVFLLAPLHVLGITRFDFQFISVVADHYQYVAILGPAILLAWAVQRWPRTAAWATALVVIYGARAAWQTPVWQDDESLYNHTLKVNPRSWTSYLNLAVLRSRAGDHAGEQMYLGSAERAHPDDPMVVVGLISFNLSQGNVAEAHRYARDLINGYNRVYVAAGSPTYLPYQNVIEQFIDAGRFDEAEDYLRELKTVSNEQEVIRSLAISIAWHRQAKGVPPSTRPMN
ncbi:MAG: Tetratricopeptide 2 repeat protein [Phycisphaerales bacterium]|nr:Tetratricopeptide 2 repeat protein [Phycisphaerales bacterium]